MAQILVGLFKRWNEKEEEEEEEDKIEDLEKNSELDFGRGRTLPRFDDKEEVRTM